MLYNKIYKAEQELRAGGNKDVYAIIHLTNGKLLKISIDWEIDYEMEEGKELFLQYHFSIGEKKDWYFFTERDWYEYMFADSKANKGLMFIRELHACGADYEAVCAAFDAAEKRREEEITSRLRLNEIAVIKNGEIINYSDKVDSAKRSISAVRVARSTAQSDFRFLWDDGQAALWRNLHPSEWECNGDKEILNMIANDKGNDDSDSALICAVLSVHTGCGWRCIHPNSNVSIVYNSDMIADSDVMRMARIVAPEVYM